MNFQKVQIENHAKYNAKAVVLNRGDTKNQRENK